MSKLSNSKRNALYFALSIVILWMLAYGCFAFILLETNPFKWEQSIRLAYVFAMVSIIAIGLPIAQIIKLELNEY